MCYVFGNPNMTCVKDVCIRVVYFEKIERKGTVFLNFTQEFVISYTFENFFFTFIFSETDFR